MDDGVHAANRVHLLRDAAGLIRAAKVSYNEAGRPGAEILDNGRTLA